MPVGEPPTLYTLTAGQCEEIFHAALSEGDARGVEAALRLLSVRDPHRAQTLLDLTKAAVGIASAPGAEPARRPAFDESRREAYRLLGDAADELRHGDWTDRPVGDRAEAARQALRLIGQAKDALNRAADDSPWQRRAAATGGGPCGSCRRPFYAHVCLSCSPDAQTPGAGCHNCRNTGMDQSPCRPPETET